MYKNLFFLFAIFSFSGCVNSSEMIVTTSDAPACTNEIDLTEYKNYIESYENARNDIDRCLIRLKNIDKFKDQCITFKIGTRVFVNNQFIFFPPKIMNVTIDDKNYFMLLDHLK